MLRDLARGGLAFAAAHLLATCVPPAYVSPPPASSALAPARASNAAPAPPAASTLPWEDRVALYAAGVRSTEASPVALRALRELPAVGACLARGANAVEAAWVVAPDGRVAQSRVFVTPPDEATRACLERAMAQALVFGPAPDGRVHHGALRAAPPPAAPRTLSPAEAAAAFAAYDGDARACARLLGPRAGSARVTLDLVVGASGAVVHAGARPVDPAWRAAAACVARQAARWYAPAHDAPAFVELEHAVALDASAPLPVALAPPAAPPALAAEHFTLANGLDVWAVPVPDAADVAVMVRYDTGTVDDPPWGRGLAHLAEHMSFYVGRHLPGGVSAALEAGGARAYNCETARRETRCYALAPARALERLLWLERQRMAFAADGFDAAALERERPAIVAEHELHEELGTGVALHAHIENALHPGDAARLDAAEDAEALRTLRAEEVRWFLQRHYAPERATLVVAGAVDPARLRPLVERLFANVARGQGAPARPPPPPNRLGEPVKLRANVRRAMLLSLWDAPPRCAEEGLDLDALLATLELRMYQDLVGGGHAVRVRASIYESESGPMTELSVTGRDGAPRPEALRALDAVLDEARAGFDPGAVAVARDQLLRGLLDEARSPGALAALQLRCPDADAGSLARRRARYEAVDAPRLRALAARWLRADRRQRVHVVPREAP